MTHTESTPTAESAESLDDLRKQLTFARDLVDALESTIASAEDDERVDFTPAPDASQVPEEGEAWVQDRARQPTPFDERALDASDTILDMTGMAVTSTAAVLAIRAAVQYRADQAQARYLAVQHGSYAVGRGRAMVARDTWLEALALVDTVIDERMS